VFLNEVLTSFSPNCRRWILKKKKSKKDGPPGAGSSIKFLFFSFFFLYEKMASENFQSDVARSNYNPNVCTHHVEIKKKKEKKNRET
jgi:hypothetical protein